MPALFASIFCRPFQHWSNNTRILTFIMTADGVTPDLLYYFECQCFGFVKVDHSWSQRTDRQPDEHGTFREKIPGYPNGTPISSFRPWPLLPVLIVISSMKHAQ